VQLKGNVYGPVSAETEKMLNWLTRKSADRKEEIVQLLSYNEPENSDVVESEFVSCTWYDGCYYCQDENKKWYQVKCYI
jgi:hypothetical protein